MPTNSLLSFCVIPLVVSFVLNHKNGMMNPNDLFFLGLKLPTSHVILLVMCFENSAVARTVRKNL